MLRIDRNGAIEMPALSQSSRSALAPFAIWLEIVASKRFRAAERGCVEHALAVATSVRRSMILLTTADQRIASTMLCGQVSVAIVMFTPREVFGEILHGDAAPCEYPYSVGDTGSCISNIPMSSAWKLPSSFHRL
ncbi:MAG: hypothetical protein R3E51_02545 [Rhizobiaceae bacterium]